MKRTFENYLIMVGIRTADYTYTDEQIFDNTEYFKKCYDDNLSAYKALLFLHDHLQEVEARDEQSINYDGMLDAVNCAVCGKELTEQEKEGGNCCDECWLRN